MLSDDFLMRYDPAESMIDHDRRKRIEQLLRENAALRDIGQGFVDRINELEAENAALCERLAVVERDNTALYERSHDEHIIAQGFVDRINELEQREQQARALLQQVADAPTLYQAVDVPMPSGRTAAIIPAVIGLDIREQARAWLADRAEQRAASQGSERVMNLHRALRSDQCADCGAALNLGGLCPKCDYCPTCGALMEACDGSLSCEVCNAREDGESPERIAQLERYWGATLKADAPPSDVCDICNGTGIAVVPVAGENADGALWSDEKRQTCHGCNGTGKRQPKADAPTEQEARE